MASMSSWNFNQRIVDYLIEMSPIDVMAWEVKWYCLDYKLMKLGQPRAGGNEVKLMMKYLEFQVQNTFLVGSIEPATISPVPYLFF